MSSKSRVDSRVRRQQILTALTVTPLDARQLAQLSVSFDAPFTDEQFVRRAMARLVRDGYAREFRYPDRTKYWKPAREGYRLVYGPDKPLPGRRAYQGVSPSLERHTRRLADLIVKLQVAAHLRGVEIAFLYGDGQATFRQQSQSKVPDLVVGFKVRGRKTYTLVVELDCGTEPVYSTKSRESLDKMIRFYLEHEASIEGTYRVVTLFDRPSSRVNHFLDRVAQLNSDPRRRVIKAGLLDNLLAHGDPLSWPLLLDWDRQLAALLPGNEAAAQTIPTPLLDSAPVAC
ncbi:MAG: replication-relaxation family protein [Pirellulales bacterium]|nr:replication-relaxation family protein [Pirellulales bacterium]